uniref:Uncharacterized protein n=1 Tax=uncultured marine virus TaxID=186617 RepID=A0A0F7L9S9_9VIRU|nr:hypothetical protein [uncultured marine virus]
MSAVERCPGQIPGSRTRNRATSREDSASSRRGLAGRGRHSGRTRHRWRTANRDREKRRPTCPAIGTRQRTANQMPA